MTYEEYRGLCKLHFGVPILRQDKPEYRASYDKEIRDLPYEVKLKMMRHPIDSPVTRDMNKGQMQRYLDAMYECFTEQGFYLTQPEVDVYYD